MAIIDLIQNAKFEQLQAIYEERQKLNIEAYAMAAAAAQKAAVYLHRETWSLHSMTYVNALLLATRRVSLKDTYTIMVLLSTIEVFSMAQTGMLGLSLENYNLSIGPVASVLIPGMIQEQQSWQPVPIPDFKYKTPYYPSGHESRRSRKQEIELDSYGELEDLGLESRDLAKVIQTVASSIGDDRGQSPGNAIERMMSKLGKLSVQNPPPDPVQRMLASLKKSAHKP